MKITYQGRSPVWVEPKQYLPGLDDGADVDVSSFTGRIGRYLEIRRVLNVGRITIPLGRWEGGNK